MGSCNCLLWQKGIIMKAVLKIECIGAESIRFLKNIDKMEALFGFAEDARHKTKNNFWVAEINGFDEKYKYQRDFLSFNKDYSNSSSTGDRGVYATYILNENRIYEVNAPISWKNHDRYFCTVNDGLIVRLKENEVNDMILDESYIKNEQKELQIDPANVIRSGKIGLGKNVVQASQQRISKVFNDFPKIYISFSGGKDSGVMLHLVMAEAIKRNRKVGVLFVDLEGQYKITIDYVEAMYEMYKDYIEPYWVAIPISLRNAVSQYEPKWVCWDELEEENWIRKPNKMSITNPHAFPFYKYAMEFEEFVPKFGKWYGDGSLTACFVGIRSDESLNRYRTVASKSKSMFEKKQWTTWCGDNLYNIYPIYDWKTEDIWRYNGKYEKPYNKLYDLMYRAGLTIHQMRICQPYGDDQRKGLWLFHIIEPETWSKVVARVNGANQGALYAQESGNVLGNIKINKPNGHTWESFSLLLLNSMPEKTKEHFENKIVMFLHWYSERGYPNGIPDDGPLEKTTPSWKRICKALLRNDYWCKGLSFSQTKSTAYTNYTKIMEKRKRQWNFLIY